MPKVTNNQHNKTDMRIFKSNRYCAGTVGQLIFALLLTFCIVTGSIAGTEAPDTKRVLVVHSYYPTRNWTKLVMDGIDVTLGTYEGIVLLDVEYMGATSIFTDAEHFENLYTIYKYKASHRQYDIIIASDNHALSFMLKHRSELYPGVPVVFCGINAPQQFALETQNRLTGVTEGITFEPTVETALRLHPKAKRILILSDEAPMIRAPLVWSSRLEELRKRTPIRPVEVSSSFLPELNTQNLVKALEGLGNETIIIFTGKLTESGRLDVFKGAKTKIQQSCSAPIYALSEQWFGYAPIVGGKFGSGYYHGQSAAEIVLRIFNGEDIDKIPIQEKGERYIFDYEQLKRFRIPFSSLPQGSVIINEPRSFYYLYRKRLWAVVTIIGFLGAISALLFANILRLKRTGRKLLDYQGKLKSLASELSLTEERQKRRIAIELHDRIGQSLVMSKVWLESLSESAPNDDTIQSLDEICDSLDEVIQNTRSLTFDLSSPILYELGLEAAVSEWLSEQIDGKHGIVTKHEDDGRSKPLDDDVRALLFRNVQELLVNVVKHAHACKVEVYSRRVNNQIQISVEDDGIGFDAKDITSKPTRTGGFGLFNVREKLEQLGGNLEIESEPGHGTRIKITAPLKQEH
jgi:signal transduction histidine kinase